MSEQGVTTITKGKSEELNTRIKFPLRNKLGLVVILTLGTIMMLTTWLNYKQQQRYLQDEVIRRGETIARSLASSAAEAVLNDLVCAALVHETMPDNQIKEYPEINFIAICESLLKDIFGNESEDIYEDTLPYSGVVEVLIVDSNDFIVAHNDIQMVAKEYVSPTGLKPYKDEEILVQLYETMEGEKRFDIAVPIIMQQLGSNGGKKIGVVHLRMSQRLVELTVKQAAIKLLLVMTVILCIGVVATIILANYLIYPINKLLEGVLAVTSGNFNQQLKIKREDEFGKLTRAFNHMTTSLREKELLKGAFSTYVSSQVMEEFLKNPEKLALGGARKRCTMLFTDIRGFTSMSETMSPEEVVSIINVYLSLQTEVVLRHGGLLDKFVGDCVMAVYGMPLYDEKDALAAVKTAIEIQAAIKTLNVQREQTGERVVNIGIGINTGEVVSGNMGSSQKMDYTVIGDEVNLAARLEAAAKGGEILISDNTFQEVKEQVVAEKLPPLLVKGKKDPVPVYRVIELKVSN